MSMAPAKRSTWPGTDVDCKTVSRLLLFWNFLSYGAAFKGDIPLVVMEKFFLRGDAYFFVKREFLALEYLLISHPRLGIGLRIVECHLQLERIVVRPVPALGQYAFRTARVAHLSRSDATLRDIECASKFCPWTE